MFLRLFGTMGKCCIEIIDVESTKPYRLSGEVIENEKVALNIPTEVLMSEEAVPF